MRMLKNLVQILLAFIIALAAYTGLYQPNKDGLKLPEINIPGVSAAKNAAASGELKITMLDIGHGDAILLQGGGKTVMVDVGDSKNRDELLRKLQQNGVKKIDDIFISHQHQDHMGNILTVAEKYNVGKIYDNGLENDGNKTSGKLFNAFASGKYQHQTIGNGDKINIGDGYWVEVFSPGDFLNKKLRQDMNNSSLVFKLHYGDFTMMFTGDIENPTEAAIAGQYGSALKADVLKVAHHGSRTSSNYRFISQVKPKYALISCGEYEKYHHPNKNVIGALEHLGAQVYSTIKNGDLTIVTDGKNIKFSKEK